MRDNKHTLLFIKWEQYQAWCGGMNAEENIKEEKMQLDLKDARDRDRTGLEGSEFHAENI